MRKYVFFIGIDISKQWIDVRLALNGNKAQMPHQRFSNDKSGFRAMLRFIRTSGMTPKDKSGWIFCMEHTGVYTLLLCEFLEKVKLAYTLFNAHHLSRSMGLRREKSDKTDAGDIARYAYLNREELRKSQLPPDRLLIIKNLLKTRKRLVKYNAGMSVAAKELEAFANKTVSTDVVRHSKAFAKHNRKIIKAIERQIQDLISTDKELQRLYDLVTSVKGVGFVIGATMLVYTVGFTAFENARQFATYAGFAPFSRTSGKSVKAPARVSHHAHKYLKGLISNGAESARQHDKELKAYYERRVKEGKCKFKVQNAIRNKLVHRIFAVVKRGTPYLELSQYKA